MSVEEFGYLSGGPGRAAEVAIVRLLEAGLLRISREGVVSAVSTTAHGAATPLEAYALGAARGGRALGSLIKATAGSGALDAVKQHLVDRGFLVSPGRRRAWGLVSFIATLVGVGAVVAVGVADLNVGIAIVLVVLALAVRWSTNRMRRPVRRAGRREVNAVTVMSNDRVGIVAQHGLAGRIGNFPNTHRVWEMLGIAPSAGATLRRGKPGRRSNDGSTSASSCSSCSSGCGSNSSCGSSSDSGSSSSCGGSSCGGGGGGD